MIRRSTLSILVIAFGGLCILASGRALAQAGHGDEPTPVVSSNAPRAETQSDDFELVAAGPGRAEGSDSVADHR